VITIRDTKANPLSPSAPLGDLQPKDVHASAAGHRFVSLNVRKAVERQLAQHREFKAVRP
jgi:hypothetical protein